MPQTRQEVRDYTDCPVCHAPVGWPCRNRQLANHMERVNRAVYLATGDASDGQLELAVAAR